MIIAVTFTFGLSFFLFFVQGAKLVYYLYELLWCHLDKLSRPQRGEVDDVMDVLQHLGLSPLRLGTRISPDLRNSLEDVSASEKRGAPTFLGMRKPLFE